MIDVVGSLQEDKSQQNLRKLLGGNKAGISEAPKLKTDNLAFCDKDFYSWVSVHIKKRHAFPHFHSFS